MTELTKEQLIEEAKLKIAIAKCHPNSGMAQVEGELFKIALASLEAEPVAVNDDMAYAFHHALSDSSLGADEVEEIKTGLRAAFANVTIQPEPVVPDEIALAIENLKQKLVECNRYNYCADAVKGVEDACHAAMLQGIQPVSQTYNLPELIEGMEVSIDVSTCDADLGNRYFGTVTEALELDTAKNGYILLVQDAEPNFDVNGNSPVTPDGWISCSDAVPAEYCNVILCDDLGNVFPGSWDKVFCPTRGGNKMAFVDKDGVEVESSTHWMPLPELPQEVK